MCYRQRDVVNPHGFVGYGVDFRSKPKGWNGSGRHRIDNAPAIDQNLDDGVGDLSEGGEDGSAERVVGS